MRVCIAHKEKSIRTLKDMADGAEYDLCQECFDQILPVLTGAIKQEGFNRHRIEVKKGQGRPVKTKDGK